MDGNKKNTIILISVLAGIVAVVFVVSMIAGSIDFGDKQSSSDDMQNVEVNNWSELLLLRNITDVQITRTRNVDAGDSQNMQKTVTITVDDLRSILESINFYEIHKHYTLGLGGIDRDHLTATYEYKDKNYKFEIYYGSIFPDNLDDDLKNILENNVTEVVNTEFQDMEGSFYFYNLIGFSSEIFDVYFE